MHEPPFLRPFESWLPPNCVIDLRLGPRARGPGLDELIQVGGTPLPPDIVMVVWKVGVVGTKEFVIDVFTIASDEDDDTIVSGHHGPAKRWKIVRV